MIGLNKAERLHPCQKEQVGISACAINQPIDGVDGFAEGWPYNFLLDL